MNQPTNKMSNIKLELKTCQYPHVWDPRNNLESILPEIPKRLVRRLKDNKLEPEFPYKYLMLYVVQSYEFALEKDTEEALKILKNAEDDYAFSCKDEKYYYNEGLRKAFLHVITAMKVHLLIEKGDEDAAVQVVSEKVNVIIDTDTSAALHILRAIFFGNYGYYGDREAVNLLDTAIILNPTKALLSLCHFLKAKYLGRVERTEYHDEEPSPEESFHYTEAVKLQKFSFYAEKLAEFYRIWGNRRYRKGIEDTDELNQKSLDFHRECAEHAKSQKNPNKLFTCAKGFLLLPGKFRCLTAAKELLDEGLKLSPLATFGNHVMAQYCERTGDYEKALHHLEIAAESKAFSPVVSLFRLQYQFREQLGINMADFIEKLKNFVEDFCELPNKIKIFDELVSYYLFISQDLTEACKYTRKVIKLNDLHDNCTMRFRICRGIFIYEKISIWKLYDVLADEIKILLNSRVCTVEEERYYEGLLNDLSERGISVRRDEPPLNLREEILKSQRENNERYRRTLRIQQSVPAKTSRGKTPIDTENWRYNSSHKGPATAIRNKN